MYHRRFQNNNARYLLDIHGKFSLMHLGGRDFMYSMRNREKGGYTIRRLALPNFNFQQHGALFLFGAALLIVAYTLFSASTTASTTEHISQNLQEVHSSEGPDHTRVMEMKTEELKNQIIALDEDSDGQKGFYHYKVKSGDTLDSISKKVGVRSDLIAASSGFKLHDTLKTGQTLTIPEKKGVVYTVKKGDVLAGVAQHYSVSIEDIESNNPDVADLDILEPGTIVFLPNAKVPVYYRVWNPPVFASITSYFGRRRHPLHHYYQQHPGVDLRVKYGTVRAARDGVVIYAGALGTYGNAVIIKHSGGFKTLYAHLSRFIVSNGKQVKAGAPIAVSGNTGFSTGPHLHFEVIKNGKAVNPLQYVKF